MQTEVKKKSWHLPGGKQKGILIWGSVIFFYTAVFVPDF